MGLTAAKEKLPQTPWPFPASCPPRSPSPTRSWCFCGLEQPSHGHRGAVAVVAVLLHCALSRLL